MARKARPVDPDSGPLQAFAHDLRVLRESVGNPTYRALSRTAGFGATALGEAAGGVRLPSLDVTLAYVGACGGDSAIWEKRWYEVNRHLSAQPHSDVEDQDADSAASPPSPPSFETSSAEPGPGRRWTRRRLGVVGAGLAVLALAVGYLTWPGPGPAARQAPHQATPVAFATNWCPTFSQTGAFSGNTRVGYVPVTVQAAADTQSRQLGSLRPGCMLQFSGYCLGEIAGDPSIRGYSTVLGLPDERWFEIEGGGLVPSAFIHGNPPPAMTPSPCPGSVPYPRSVRLKVAVGDPAPGTVTVSADVTDAPIIGYAAYFVPAGASGTEPAWFQVGGPTDTTMSRDFIVSWPFGKVGEPQAAAAVPVIAVACLAGEAPTSVVDAEQVVLAGSGATRPADLSPSQLAAGEAVACQYPQSN